LEIVDILDQVPCEDVLVVDHDLIDHDLVENGMHFVEDLEMGVKERVISGNGVYFLSDPDFILLLVVVLFITDIHEIGDLQTDYEEEIVGIRNVEKGFLEGGVLLD
jgi:hypothetical protein